MITPQEVSSTIDPVKAYGGGSRDSGTVKVWIPLALGAVVVVAYVFLYSLSSSGGQGATSIGMVNTIGLLAVFVGLIAAGLLLRRAAPHQ